MGPSLGGSGSVAGSSSGNSVKLTVVVFSSCKMYQFSGSGPTFSGTAGVVGSVALSFDYAACVYRFVDCQGNVFLFDCQGGFKQVTLVNGNLVQVIQDSNGNLSDVQASIVDPASGDTTVTSTQYTLVASGPNAGQVASVTLRRQVNGGPWTEIQRVLYTYYGSGDLAGSVGDLQFVTTQVTQGTAWVTTSTSYYRYYTAASSRGFVHGLKHVLGDEALRRLEADPRGANPALAPDSVVAQYADNYYEYDGSQRVTKAVTDGGLYTYGYSYQLSGLTPPSSDPYNTWISSTTINLPGPAGYQEIVYANSVNDMILHVLFDGTNKWCEYHQFNTNAQETLMAEPSAVSGYTGGTPSVPALTVNLYSATGLVHITDYFSGTTTATPTTPGNVQGFVLDTKVQEGISGTPPAVLQSTMQYFANTASGVTIYPVANQTVYRNTDGSGPITTSYGYNYFPGSNQVQQQTTYLPVVSPSQHGTGGQDTITNIFDMFGNLIWNRGAQRLHHLQRLRRRAGSDHAVDRGRERRVADVAVGLEHAGGRRTAPDLR